ncbi:uncharacterized protein nell3 [Denticeps clupeoides]|uniref:uncharacterized protein nell3 n=1 Tax=Denticeps clupeoides TaxID=299321 RepID=UPI0010A36613|nr:uncharacterized protein LOC114771949 [Denticeps clupeoides]
MLLLLLSCVSALCLGLDAGDPNPDPNPDLNPDPNPADDTPSCRGVECQPCAGDGQTPLLHLAENPDLGYPAPLGVQLTCDLRPGENEVPSEDALVLHLQLSGGQEKLVETLRSQQAVIHELQQRLVEQQGALLAQQHQILDQMDVVKAQYGLLSDALKQTSVHDLQSQARALLQKSYAVHKLDVDATVMELPGHARRPGPPASCPAACGSEEYCDFQRDPPSCQKCTTCPPGFFLVSQCSANTDRMCQDRDECLELPSLCGEHVKCLNTPGGFRCLGAVAGLCGHEYFYHQELQECQACSDCDGVPAAQPCTATSDAVCAPPSEERLSRAWGAAVAVPTAGDRAAPRIFSPGLQLDLQGGADGDLLSNRDGRLVFRRHGLVWIDHNLAVRHGCRNFLRVGLRLNRSEEEGRELSAVRLEQPERKHFQAASVSAAAEVEPDHALTAFLRSPNQHCDQRRDVQALQLSGRPFSLLWLSHDTGAVAMTAQASPSTPHHTHYRPAFRAPSVSDPYVVTLTHDGRGVSFAEGGAVRFVLQQAVYAMGHACVPEGFSAVAYVNRNGSNAEVARAFKPGVNYRDTSVTLSGTARVAAGDFLNFEIRSPAQCTARYFADAPGISALSLVWVPAAMSAELTAAVSPAGLPPGAVRDKALFFRQVGPDAAQVRMGGPGHAHGRRDFVFAEDGTASVALNLKLIHSCSVVKLTLLTQGGAPVAQQAAGHMTEGSEWAGMSLRASFAVHNGTAVHVALDCARGRVNRIAQDGGSNVSILWVAL